MRIGVKYSISLSLPLVSIGHSKFCMTPFLNYERRRCRNLLTLLGTFCITFYVHLQIRYQRRRLHAREVAVISSATVRKSFQLIWNNAVLWRVCDLISAWL